MNALGGSMLARHRFVVAACLVAAAALTNVLSFRWDAPAHGGAKFDPLGRVAHAAEAVQKSWQVWMKKRHLLARLARLGPLPDDAAVTQAQLDEFLDIVGLIDSGSTPPDPDYIRPLLDAFGYGDGYAGYTHGAWALLKQDRAAVVEAALDTLETGGDGPRQWAMETLRRLRERDRGDPPPSPREFRCVEVALTGGSPLVAVAAVYWAYWVGGVEGQRLLELAARVATGEARQRAAELLVP